MHTVKLEIPTLSDFSFHETVHSHGWRDLPPFTWNASQSILSWPQRLSDGTIAQITIADDGKGHLVADVDHDVNADEVMRYVNRVLQMDKSLTAFHTYCTATPGLEHVVRRKQGRLLRSPSLFEDVVRVILTTNTTWAQTKAMVGRMCALSTEEAIEGAMQPFPTPEMIAALPFEEFAERARLGYRNGAVHALALDIAVGKLDLEAWNDPAITHDDLSKRLLSLRGIGPYGAACLMLYLGHGSKVNVDSWARMLVSRELGRKVTDKEVYEFFASYGEWQGLVYHFYDWKHEQEGAATGVVTPA